MHIFCLLFSNFSYQPYTVRNPDSAVNTVTTVRAGERKIAIRLPPRTTDFSLFPEPHTPDLVFINFHVPLVLSGFWVDFTSGLKRPWREADHSPPFSVDVVNKWSVTPRPHKQCAQKHLDLYHSVHCKCDTERNIFQKLLALFAIVVNIFDALIWRKDINTKYPVIGIISNKLCRPRDFNFSSTLIAHPISNYEVLNITGLNSNKI